MKLTLKIPSSWNQCSDKQLYKIALLIHSGLDNVKFENKCFKILANCKWYQIYKRMLTIFILSNIPIRELKQDFQFIFDSNTLTRFPKLKNKKLNSPLEHMSNLTIAEMAVADDLHIKWRNTHQVENLHYLAATLYVANQQPRPVFDKNNLPKAVKQFQKLSLAELLVIEMAFAGCKEFMADMFPTVFPKRTENTTNKKTKKVTSSQFPKLILELSGGKFGNHQQTQQTNCYTFLAEFENLLKNQK